MRTITTAQQSVLTAGVQAEHLRVFIKDSGGTFRDLTSYPGFNAVRSVTYSERVADPHMTADIVLSRELYKLSLSPYMTTSAINKAFNPAASADPLLALNREVKIEVAITSADKQPASGDWMEVFRGRVDEIDAAATTGVRLACRDLGGRLAQQFIKVEHVLSYASVSGAAVPLRIWQPETAYALGEYLLPASRGSGDSGNNKFFICSLAGTSGQVEPVWGTGTAIPDDTPSGTCEWDYVGAPTTAGNPVEQIMQNILTRHKAAGDPTVTLYTPTSPGWAIRQYLQRREYVLTALRTLAHQIGWDVRYKWRSGTNQFELTFYQPTRTAPAVNYTFAAGDYEDPTKLSVNIAEIRNAWRVIYTSRTSTHPDGSGVRMVVEVSDSASITKYGELWAEIQEDSNSQVDTNTEALALANAALSDCKEPTAELSVPLTRGFPWVELNDYMTFTANGKHFDTNRSAAVTGWSQTYDGTRLRTTLELRGLPTIGAETHLSRTEHPYATLYREPHRIQHFNGTETKTATLSPDIGGFSARFQEVLDKAALFEEETELHVSTVTDFTPSASTLKTLAKGGKTVTDLVPGKTYYVKTVPRFRNAGRLVRGEPSAQQSFVAARAKAGHYDSLVSQGHFPLNGNFEHAFDDLTSNPFDHWNVTSGTWGSSGDLYWGNDATYGNYVSIRLTGGDPGLRSDAFPVRRMGGHFNLYMSVRPQGTLSAGRGLRVYVRFYRKSDLSDSPILFTYTVPYNVAAANVWSNHVVNSEFIGALPNDVNFCTIAFGRESITSAYGFDIGDIFFCEAQQEDLWATTRAFVPTLYGTSTTTQPTIYQTGWVNFSTSGFLNSFSDYDTASYSQCAYMKDSFGFVNLKGLFKRTTAALSTPVFTLPVGFRPPKNITLLVNAAGQYAYLEIQTDGDIIVVSASSATWYSYVSIDNIRFSTT